MTDRTGNAYAEAGVNIEAADRAIDLMKGWVEKATRPEVIGGLGGFILPIAFGAMNDLVGVWTSCFMLLFVIVAASLVWMHLAIRRMEKAENPALRAPRDLRHEPHQRRERVVQRRRHLRARMREALRRLRRQRADRLRDRGDARDALRLVRRPLRDRRDQVPC